MIDLHDGKWTFDDKSLVQGVSKVIWAREGKTRYRAPDFYLKRDIDCSHCAFVQQTFYLNYHGFVANISWKRNLAGVDFESCVRAGDRQGSIRGRESSLNGAYKAISIFYIGVDSEIRINN